MNNNEFDDPFKMDTNQMKRIHTQEKSQPKKIYPIKNKKRDLSEIPLDDLVSIKGTTHVSEISINKKVLGSNLNYYGACRY